MVSGHAEVDTQEMGQILAKHRRPDLYDRENAGK